MSIELFLGLDLADSSVAPDAQLPAIAASLAEAYNGEIEAGKAAADVAAATAAVEKAKAIKAALETVNGRMAAADAAKAELDALAPIEAPVADEAPVAAAADAEAAIDAAEAKVAEANAKLDATAAVSAAVEVSADKAIAAAVHVGGYTEEGAVIPQGEFSSFDQLAEAMRSSLSRKNEETEVIASIQLWDDDHPLALVDESFGSAGRWMNRDRIRNSDSARALEPVAAAICPEEYERLRDPAECFRSGRPLYDRLQKRPMNTLEVQIAQDVDIEGGPHDWTYGVVDHCEDPEVIDGNQQGIDPADESTWKSECATLACQTYDSFFLEAFYWCLKVCRDDELTNPRGIEAALRKLASKTDKWAEAKLMYQMLLASVNAGNSFELTTPTLNAAHDLYAALETVLSGIETDNDLGDYQAIIPAGMQRYLNREKYATSVCCNASVGEVFNDLGIGILGETPYQIAGLNAPRPRVGAEGMTLDIGPLVNGATPTFDFFLVKPGDVAVGVGQEISIGTGQRFADWDLTRQNCRGMFYEKEETLVHTGCDPILHFRVALCPSGKRSELTEFTCAAPSDPGTPSLEEGGGIRPADALGAKKAAAKTTAKKADA